MGCARVDHQCCQAFVAALQNIAEFHAGAHQAGGRQIGSIHGQGQIQHDHLGIDFFLHCLGEFLPGRPGHGDAGQQPANQQQDQRRTALGTLTALDQMGQQMG